MVPRPNENQEQMINKVTEIYQFEEDFEYFWPSANWYIIYKRDRQQRWTFLGMVNQPKLSQDCSNNSSLHP